MRRFLLYIGSVSKRLTTRYGLNHTTGKIPQGNILHGPSGHQNTVHQVLGQSSKRQPDRRKGQKYGLRRLREEGLGIQDVQPLFPQSHSWNIRRLLRKFILT